MGKGGYIGGSTIIKLSVPRTPKTKTASVTDDYDFEQSAEDIRREMEERKRKLAQGQSLIEISRSSKPIKRKKKTKDAKKSNASGQPSGT